jgi:hypothetical protein
MTAVLPLTANPTSLVACHTMFVNAYTDLGLKFLGLFLA